MLETIKAKCKDGIYKLQKRMNKIPFQQPYQACDTCAEANIQRSPHKRRQDPPDPNTLSHDTAGPYVISTTRERYLHVIVHNYSGKMFAKATRSKAEAPEQIRNTISAIKSNHRKLITRVHSNRA
eukprot:IDg1952t1